MDAVSSFHVSDYTMSHCVYSFIYLSLVYVITFYSGHRVYGCSDFLHNVNNHVSAYSIIIFFYLFVIYLARYYSGCLGDGCTIFLLNVRYPHIRLQNVTLISLFIYYCFGNDICPRYPEKQ